MRVVVGVVLVFLVTANYSQQVPQKYFVAFTDKNGTPYSISDPQAFLTQRAIDRRTAQGIAITDEDLPVNPDYANGVAATGVQLFSRSKWFNGITIQATDSSVLNSIRSLPYVLSVTQVSSYSGLSPNLADNKFSMVMNATHSIKSGEGATLTLNNLSGLAPGMYILKVSSGTTSEYLHLVKVQ